MLMLVQRQVGSADPRQSCFECKSFNLLTFKTIYLTGSEALESSPQVLPTDQSQDNPTSQSGNNAEVEVKQEPVHSQITDSNAA